MKKAKLILNIVITLIIFAPIINVWIDYVFDTDPTELIITTRPAVETEKEAPPSYSSPIDPGDIENMDEIDSTSDMADKEEVDTQIETEEQVLRVFSLTSPVKNGAKATLDVIGKPDTMYTITVTYKSVSKASGLEPKRSDSYGNVSWTWRVGVNTSPGEHPIEVKGGGEVLKTSFVTVEE